VQRLQKVMAHAGVASRRQCEKIISAGRVTVNGEVVRELGTRVDPEKDCIEIDGEPISREEKVYLIVNKPANYITSVSDPRGRPVVMDLISDIGKRIYPVGRLDFDSEGLLLLTNDGNLAHKLTHPRWGVEKEYIVVVDGNPRDDELEQLARGMELQDGLTVPARVSELTRRKGESTVSITIHEGRNRQVRRMFGTLGYQVRSLRRVRFGPLSLGNLPAGKWRYCTRQEVALLRDAVSGPPPPPQK